MHVITVIYYEARKRQKQQLNL